MSVSASEGAKITNPELALEDLREVAEELQISLRLSRPRHGKSMMMMVLAPSRPGKKKPAAEPAPSPEPEE